MKLNLAVSPGRRFVPATDDDRAKARALPVGALLPVSIKVPRNLKHHQKFRLLVKFVADHHPIWRTEADVMLELKLRTGHYREHIRPRAQSAVPVEIRRFLALYKARLRDRGGEIVDEELDAAFMAADSALAREPEFEVVFDPLGTNFFDMDEGEFIEWSAKAKRVIVDLMLPGFRPADIRRLERELDDWTEWCLQ